MIEKKTFSRRKADLGKRAKEITGKKTARMQEDIDTLTPDESRRQTEEKLRLSEENYRHSFEELPLGVRIVTEDGETIYANRALLDIYGYESLEDLKTTSVEERYTPESHADFLIRREKRQQGVDVPSQYTISIIRKDREIRYLQVIRKAVPWDGKRQFQVLYTDITERRKADTAIRESEESFRAVTENAYDGIIIVSITGTHIYANKRSSEITGYSIEELLEINMIELAHPDEIPKLSETLRKRMAGEEAPIMYETALVHKEGRVVSIELTGAKTFWHGQVADIIIFRDITDRKKAEERLRDSEERYRALFDRSLDCIYLHDFAGNFLDANNPALNLLGYRRADIPSLNFATLLSEDQMPFALGVLQEIMDTGYQKKVTEFRLKTKKGDDVFVETIGSAILQNGIPSAVQAIARNITGRKQLERHLEESAETMRYIVKHDPTALAVYDRNLHYIAVSNRYLQDYNIKESDVIGKHHYEVFPEMPQKWRDVHQRCLAGAIERNDDDWFERPDGSITFNRWECRPWHGTDGEIGGIITYTEVTTERKKALEELRTSRLRLRALARRLQQIREEERIVVAREIHDEMGGGLTGLKMDLSWLLRKMDGAVPGEGRVALMDKIHSSNALIDQMICTVRRISTDLRPSILDDLGLIAALEWQLSEFTSRTEIPHEFATVLEYVDIEEDTAVAVFRIFQEALTNVVRHARATKVAVVLREDVRSLSGDENIVLEIRDNGRGITEGEILNPASLGLLGMKERVLAFGGELSIRGEAGGGTALVLKIPRKERTAS